MWVQISETSRRFLHFSLYSAEHKLTVEMTKVVGSNKVCSAIVLCLAGVEMTKVVGFKELGFMDTKVGGIITRISNGRLIVPVSWILRLAGPSLVNVGMIQLFSFIMSPVFKIDSRRWRRFRR